MSTRILYNSANPFFGISTIPLVSRGVEMIRFGNRWGQLHTITLNGEITGNCPTFTGILNRQAQLLSGFRQDYQQLYIEENGSGVMSFDFVKVANISFDSNVYALPILPYTIQLEAYPSGYFSGTYGVLDPVDEFNFSEDEDGIVTVSHSVSARGFNTSATTNNSLLNAKNYVATRTGWSNQVLPAFISGMNLNLCLQTINEVSDRLNGTYEVRESYISDIYESGVGILRYSTDYASGIEDGISTLTVQGNIQGCKYQDLASLRSRYAGFNAYSEAVNQFQRVAGRTDLNPNPESKSVTEDQTNKVVDFTYVYDDDLRPKIVIIYNIDLEYDIENDIISVGVGAEIYSRGQYTSTRWAEVLAVANAINLFSIAVPAYNIYVAEVAPHLAGYPLNPNATTISRTENEFGARVNLSATYTNKPLPPPGLKEFEYTLDFTPSIQQKSLAPILDADNLYYGVDRGFLNRALCSIQARGIGDDTVTPAQTVAIIKSEILRLQNEYFAGSRKTLDEQQITQSNSSFEKNYSANVSYSAEQSEFLIP